MRAIGKLGGKKFANLNVCVCARVCHGGCRGRKNRRIDIMALQIGTRPKATLKKRKADYIQYIKYIKPNILFLVRAAFTAISCQILKKNSGELIKMCQPLLDFDKTTGGTE